MARDLHCPVTHCASDDLHLAGYSLLFAAAFVVFPNSVTIIRGSCSAQKDVLWLSYEYSFYDFPDIIPQGLPSRHYIHNEFFDGVAEPSISSALFCSVIL